MSAQNSLRIGRDRVDQEAGDEKALSILAAVRERDIFKPRAPEGKARGSTS